MVCGRSDIAAQTPIGPSQDGTAYCASGKTFEQQGREPGGHPLECRGWPPFNLHA